MRAQSLNYPKSPRSPRITSPTPGDIPGTRHFFLFVVVFVMLLLLLLIGLSAFVWWFYVVVVVVELAHALMALYTFFNVFLFFVVFCDL